MINIQEKLRQLLISIWKQFKRHQHIKDLKKIIDPYHFRSSSRLGAGRITRYQLTLVNAPKEFHELLEKEFGEAAPYLPITYKIERHTFWKTAQIRSNPKHAAAPAKRLSNRAYANNVAGNSMINRHHREASDHTTRSSVPTSHDTGPSFSSGGTCSSSDGGGGTSSCD